MALKINTEPEIEPISLFEVKDHLRLDHDEHTEDDLIKTTLIPAARKYCELRQNRTYITQTWELWLDAFPDKGYIEIPKPPLQSVDSIKYYDTSDSEATFSSSYYTVDDKDQYSPKVFLNYGQSWPSTALRPYNGVCVTFVAGYGDDGYDVPQNVRSAMLLFIGHLYENREAVVTTGLNAVEIPKGVDALLSLEGVF